MFLLKQVSYGEKMTPGSRIAYIDIDGREKLKKMLTTSSGINSRGIEDKLLSDTNIVKIGTISSINQKARHIYIDKKPEYISFKAVLGNEHDFKDGFRTYLEDLTWSLGISVENDEYPDGMPYLGRTPYPIWKYPVDGWSEIISSEKRQTIEALVEAAKDRDFEFIKRTGEISGNKHEFFIKPEAFLSVLDKDESVFDTVKDAYLGNAIQ
jgi:hypothetical protein